MRGKCAPDGDNGDYVPFSELDVPGNGVEKRERENRKKTESGRCEGGERERERERERNGKYTSTDLAEKNSELVSFSIGHVVRWRVTTSKYCFGQVALSKHRWRAATLKIMRRSLDRNSRFLLFRKHLAHREPASYRVARK